MADLEWSHPDVELEELIGQVFDEVVYDEGAQTVDFIKDGSTRYALGHVSDCCESVWLDDVNGDWSCLAGQPITIAEERSHHSAADELESTTWTFYLFASPKGTVLLRWCGTSNGYYSESVELYDITKSRWND